MKRKAKLFLIISLIVVVVCGFGSWFVGSRIKETVFYVKNDAAAVGDFYLADIGADWSMDKFLLHGAAELYVSNTDEEKQAFLDTMKENLGAFKSGKGKVETLAEAEDMDGGLAFEAVYVCDAVFEKQKARIKMVLLRRQSVGDWSIVSFDVWPENQPEEEPAATPPSA